MKIMVTGICKIQLALFGNRSLKGKRQVLRSIKDRVKNKFNVSVAEVESHDAHQRAVLGVCVVAVDVAGADSQLQHVLSFISAQAEVLDVDLEFVKN